MLSPCPVPFATREEGVWRKTRRGRGTKFLCWGSHAGIIQANRGSCCTCQGGPPSPAGGHLRKARPFLDAFSSLGPDWPAVSTSFYFHLCPAPKFTQFMHVLRRMSGKKFPEPEVSFRFGTALSFPSKGAPFSELFSTEWWRHAHTREVDASDEGGRHT